MADKKQGFRVVIVGGSIAGLTLAHCLMHYGIDFVVLEARNEIAPQEGASISFWPTSVLTLDQLGIFEDIEKLIIPLKTIYNWECSGKPICALDGPQEMLKAHGYPASFLERQKALEIFYDRLGEEKKSVFTGKRVTNIEHFDTHVVAHCADGSSFQGDILVGADGVRSKVKELMWNYMDARGLKEEAEKERERLSCEYSCIFGISSPVPGLKAPDCHRIWGPDWSLLIVIGKDEKVYWFMFNRLDRVYKTKEIPRFDQAKIDEHLAPFLKYPIVPTVPFAEIINRAEVKNWLPVEEALYKYWCIDRVACIGDSVHKMTPNAGLGANSAIETAVSLANSINSMTQNSSDCQTKDIDRCLKKWQENREERLIPNYDVSAFFVRLETQASLKYKIMKYAVKQLTLAQAKSRQIVLAAAEYVECLPPPPRSYNGTLAWKCHDSFRPVVEKPSQRRKWALPLLGFAAVGLATIVPTIMQLRPSVEEILRLGNFTTSTGDLINISAPIFQLKSVDGFVRPMVARCLPLITSNSLSWTQAFTFINDYSSIYGIWLLEGYHKRHSTSEVILPIVMGSLAQIGGIGIAGPLYYLLQYLSLPLSKVTFNNIREVEPSTTYTLLPALAAAQCIPAAASFLALSLQDRVWYNALWQLSPLTVPLLQISLEKLVGKKSTESAKPEIRKENRQKSIRAIRFAYGSFAAVSAVGFLYARAMAPAGTSVLSIFVPSLSVPVSFSEGASALSQFNQVVSMAAGFTWLGLRLRELKMNGMEVSWLKAFAGLVGTTIAFGPGTAFALGWGWKEELLHRVGV